MVNDRVPSVGRCEHDFDLRHDVLCLVCKDFPFIPGRPTSVNSKSTLGSVARIDSAVFGSAASSTR